MRLANQEAIGFRADIELQGRRTSLACIMSIIFNPKAARTTPCIDIAEDRSSL